MKKLGKKLNYFIKVFLAVGLLFSNLTSLTVVFAYDGEDESFEDKTGEVTTLEDDTVSDTENETTTLEDTNKGEEDTPNQEENKETDLEEQSLDEDNQAIATGEDDTTLEDDDKVNEGEVSDKSDNNSGEEPYVEYDYTKMLNDSASDLGLESAYSFKEEEGKKVLYVIRGVNDNEVKQIVSNAFSDVTCEIIEDEIVLTRGEEEVVYEVAIYDEEYLSELIKNAVGNEEEPVLDGDINGDGKIDEKDVVTLNNILKNGFSDYAIEKSDDKINSRLDAYVGAEKVDGEVSVSTGDTFTVHYVLTLSKNGVDTVTGNIVYNKDLLSLENVEAVSLLTGEVYEGKYIYLGDYIMGSSEVNEETGELEYQDTDYVIITMTFKSLASGSDTISISNLGYYYEDVYYEGNNINNVMVVVLSSDNSLSSLSVAGQEIKLEDGVYEYQITVSEDVSLADVVASVSDDSGAVITSIVAPEELAIGENEITIEVTAEDGTTSVYTIKVVRGEIPQEESSSEETVVVSPINYNEADDSNTEPEKEITPADDDVKPVPDDKPQEKDDGKLSRIIIVVLILLALAGLIYLIFKDDDEEVKKANKDIDRLKKEDITKEKSKNKTNKKVDKNHKKGR